MNIGLIVTLLVVGLVLLLLEILVIPGIGVAGIIGLVSLSFGCYFSFGYGTTTGLIVTAAVILLLIVLLWWALREKTWKKLALNTQVQSSAGQDSAVVAVGDQGVTTTRLAPMGTARIADKTVEVKSLEGYLDPGKNVTVAMIEDNIIYVKTINI